MIFIGFGFLMVFLKTHCWSSIGINYICAAWCIQCGILFQGFWHRALVHGFHDRINVNLLSVIEGEFCAAAFLITMGALLGKASFAQLFFIATFESVFFTLNAIILFQLLKVVDIGGAMTIHMFGAYFGLAATYFFEPAKAKEDKRGLAGGNYSSQLIAMVGCVFLFMFWPSFNGILGTGMAQTRAVVNTVISITASCISATVVSRLISEHRQIDMEVLLNATLAGGVMMGAAADLIVHPGWTMFAGALCGAISAFGFLKLNEMCQKKLNLHDTCGVQFLHGIPGTLGSITAGICTAVASYSFENDAQIK
jgi:ammonium transporter Rh